MDCYKAMCGECMKTHVEKWKASAIKFCGGLNGKIKKYLSKIDALTPLMEKNNSKIEQIKIGKFKGK